MSGVRQGAYFVAVFTRELPHNFINSMSNNSSSSGDEGVVQLDAGNGTAAPPPSNYEEMPPYVWAPILLGIFLIVAAVVGLAGAKYYSRLLLLVYVVLVAGMLITQFVLGMLLLLSPSTLAAGLGLAQEQVEPAVVVSAPAPHAPCCQRSQLCTPAPLSRPSITRVLPLRTHP
jgi:hypothetical protein